MCFGGLDQVDQMQLGCDEPSMRLKRRWNRAWNESTTNSLTFFCFVAELNVI